MFLQKLSAQGKKQMAGIGWIFLLIFTLNACENNTEKKTLSSKSSPDTLVGTNHKTTLLHPVTNKTRETYQWYCAQCHGIQGKGDGINSQHIIVPPRNHTKHGYLETRSDQQLFDAIQLGGLKIGRAPCMPAWKYTLENDMIWSLVRYIRELCDCEAL